VLPWACLPCRGLGPLHRVLPMIWSYLENPNKYSRQKYSARPITLPHGEILINRFLRVNRGALQMRIVVLTTGALGHRLSAFYF
jgi:hypothetical protein